MVFKQVGIFLFFSVALLCLVNPVHAADVMVFDSTDHYLGGCQLTNKSSWELTKDINVTNFQIWYNWDQGEASLPAKVFRNGELFAEFEAKRGNCDPYQHQWCNADYAINKLFPQGTYTTEIPTNRQCLKPGGTGAIRLYTADSAALLATPAATTPVTPAPALAVTPTPVAAITPLPPVAASNSCSCNQVTIIAAAAGISAVTSFLVNLLFKLVFKK